MTKVIRRTQPTTVTFVPRSLGNALAVTERKYFDTEVTRALVNVATSWAGAEQDPTTIGNLCSPQQGTSALTRVGTRINVLAIKIRGKITVASQTNQATGDTPAACRIILVQDMQTNAVQLNAEDVISSGAGSNGTEMFQNIDFFGRFRVLRDKRMIMQNPNLSWDGTNLEQQGLQRNFEWIVKFRKPVQVRFNATNSGNVADIVDNSFHVIGGVNNTELAASLAYKCRAVFVDP